MADLLELFSDYKSDPETYMPLYKVPFWERHAKIPSAIALPISSLNRIMYINPIAIESKQKEVVVSNDLPSIGMLQTIVASIIIRDSIADIPIQLEKSSLNIETLRKIAPDCARYKYHNSVHGLGKLCAKKIVGATDEEYAALFCWFEESVKVGSFRVLANYFKIDTDFDVSKIKVTSRGIKRSHIVV